MAECVPLFSTDPSLAADLMAGGGKAQRENWLFLFGPRFGSQFPVLHTVP